MKRNKNNSLFDPVLLRRSLRASFTKLDPRQMIKNPIMFTVEAVTFAMLLLIVRIAVTGDTSQGSLLYNLVIFAVLLLTVLFANFAEAIAEARGRAQADSLRKTREETPAKRIEPDGQSHIVSSSELKQGDLFECVAGDTVAADGEIVEGLASIDESAITGESAPVIREAGGDKSSVTGGTKVLSDRILVKVTARPGESFLDRMIALVEGSSRQKTPNEIALTILLAGFTLVFVIVCATLKPFADYVGANITVAAFISLFVCLIPTTIGGLLSAIGIAGMDRALRANVITKSGKAVETAGDIDTLLLDKTGTITIGNRKATRFHPADGIAPKAFVRMCVLSSVADPTPEGKSVVELGAAEGVRTDPVAMVGVRMVKFTAETKCSGVDMPDGRRIRKGAAEAIFRIAAEHENPCPAGIAATVRTISENGGTPLVVCENERITGVIELQDIIKTGIRERFERLRRMGVKTVMVTGDNPLTAKYIAEKAGVDDFIAEARPEDKLEYIRREQQSGKLVAMMGDGTNDAPALKTAQVGLSMGDGTSVAKEASDITIIDNSFSSIGRAVMWGRSLYKNIQRFLLFQLTVNVAACFLVLFGSFMGNESPLTVTQMLWENLIMDTFGAMALASLPPSRSVMDEKPRSRTASILTRPMLSELIGVGVLFFAITLGFYWFFNHYEVTSIPQMFHAVIDSEQMMTPYEATLLFSIFVWTHFWYMFNARSFETGESIFKLKMSGGFWTIVMIIVIGQLFITEIAYEFFNVQPMLHTADWHFNASGALDLLIIVAASSLVLWVREVYHLFVRK
ncbi:MAG: potassium-transporting ATPase subunit KdpB [Muribaculaceae bacterium]|nr:potassium-transporting ATPase subunit KdpB [Muribaculaceae bacterium]